MLWLMVWLTKWQIESAATQAVAPASSGMLDDEFATFLAAHGFVQRGRDRPRMALHVLRPLEAVAVTRPPEEGDDVFLEADECLRLRKVAQLETSIDLIEPFVSVTVLAR